MRHPEVLTVTPAPFSEGLEGADSLRDGGELTSLHPSQGSPSPMTMTQECGGENGEALLPPGETDSEAVPTPGSRWN